MLAVSIVRITGDEIRSLEETSLAKQNLTERGDLQRLLKKNIDVVTPGLRIIAEEFGQWEDSRRRIDLLALDRDANLVVIELKRADSAHMELQAIRYAAMVAPLTFDQLARIHSDYLESDEDDARDEILTFLDWEDEDSEPSLKGVRIVLVAADFSKELTTAVLWLNENGLDIRCVRLKLYREAELLLADVQQIIPLKEAEEYVTRVQEKRREERASARRGGTMEEFWAALPRDLHPVARDFIGWCESKFTRLSPGTAGCTPIVSVGDQNHILFRINNGGNVAVWFDWMARKHPFEKHELREELIQKLNTIDGVDLPHDEELKKRPRFAIRVLEKPQAMARMKEVVRWWLDQVGAAPGNS